MNRKLISLAVAAALVAPAAAMADAVLYGRVHVSLDYQNVDNVIQPWYNNSARAAIPAAPSIGLGPVAANPGDIFFVNPSGAPYVSTVPAGVPLTPAQQAIYNEAVRQGYAPLAPGQMTAGVDFEGWGMSGGSGFQGVGRSSILGVKGSEDLGGGLKAIYQIELDIKMNNSATNFNVVDNNDGFTYRNTFVGLAGGWGTALMGRHDTPLKISTGKLDLFADTMADYNGTIGFQDLRADNAVAYISPSFSGFTLAAAIIPGSMSTADNAFGQNINSDSIAEGYSIAGIYSNGPFYASAAYELVSTEHLMSTATSLNPCVANPIFGPNTSLTGTAQVGTQTSCNKAEDDLTKWRLGLGLLDWNGFSLTGIYEKQEGLPAGQAYTSVSFTDARWGDFGWTLPGGADEKELWQIQAGYRFGNFQFKAMYGETSSSADYSYPSFAGLGATGPNAAQYANSASNVFDNTTTSWALGFDYNFSKRTQAYILYTANTSDAGDNPRFTNGLGSAPGVASNAAQLQAGIPAREWDGFSIGMSHRF